MKLRNSPAITRVPRLESEHFNHNLPDPDLIRASLDKFREYFADFGKHYALIGGAASDLLMP